MTKAEEIKEIVKEATPNKRNVDEQTAHLRDTYLSSEYDYASIILKFDILQKYVSVYNELDSEKLYQDAMDLIEKVELNLIPEENMKKTEQLLIILLAAIQDKQRVKVLSYSQDNEENDKTRNRVR
jgi:hypothetical protein